MTELQKFISENDYPQIDLSKEQNKWHKLEDENFKGSFRFVELKFGDKTVTVVTVHNFRSGETNTERFGEAELTKTEIAAVKKQLDTAALEAKKEEKRKHEQCKSYANEQFPTFTQVDLSANPYLKRKIPQSPRSTKVYQRENLVGEIDLICPIVSFAGDLWNYQSINPGGEKQILIGGKYRGLFIPILPDNTSVNGLKTINRVYIVEGFSTGISVFLALDKKFPVLCAISSTNILNVVAGFRSINGRAPVIICADNDCWKQDHENTGEASASDAVSRVDGAAYGSPDFSRCSESELATKPTDYNDLHNLCGIDEVRTQVEKIAVNRPRIIYPLGYNQKSYFFTTSKVPQVQALTEFTETDIIKLAPIGYWETRFPKEKGSGFDSLRVKNYLIEQCQNKGLFESTRLRGRGVYLDEEKYVLHAGDKIKFLETGEERDLADLKSSYYYDPRPRWNYAGEPPADNLLPQIHSAIKRFAWSAPLEATLCLGWLLTTPLAGCLGWRSHLAITAEAGTGKTTLLNAMNSMLAGWLPLKSEGLTEAGLRQSLGSDAVPVILDEQDTNSLDLKAFDKIMTLFRMASSEGEVRRGTVSGKALKFNACFSGCIAGINLPKMKHADLTRFCIIELNPNNKTGSWQSMSSDIKILFQSATARQLHTWTLENISKIKKSIEDIMPLIESFSDARTAQQYGSLLGASAYALGIPLETAVEQLKAYWKRSDTTYDAEKDSESCLEHLMDLVVVTDSERKQVSLAQTLENNNAPDGVLGQFKMKIVGGKLFIPNSHPTLARHFDKTPWSNWNKALRRTSMAEPKILKLGGITVRGILLPVTTKTPEI